MSANMMSLEQVQRAMAAAVMQPLTADEEMQSTAPDGHSMAALAESFIAPNSRLTPFERLEIYNRQYWFRVLGALAEDFSVLRLVVGARAFEMISVAYLVEHPSRSFTLRNLGSRLPEWLARHPQMAGRRHRLAVDIARVEWAFVEAFDGSEHDPLTAEQIATLDGGSRLALQPHLRLLALEYPADDVVRGLHTDKKRQASEAGIGSEEIDEALAVLPRMRRRPMWVAAHRVEHAVYYKRLRREEFVTLRCLGEGRLLADAIAAGFAESRLNDVQTARCLRAWFANWAELGWLCAPAIESLMEGM